MSTPVAAVLSAPKFGGLTGYKRPALGKPTQVPTNLPAFRGKTATPGGEIKAPPIQNSKNRQDRGTNVTIPYARLCPIEHAIDIGRISQGDVAFVSRYHVDVSHVNMQRKERVAGIDFLNKCLGNDDSIRPAAAKIHPNWVVGKTVVLGGNSAFYGDKFDPVGSAMADNWREASFLRDWCCDGIVLSNDEPYAHTSNGSNDVQQFNICVQGISSVNNGFVNHKNNGVELYPRSQTEVNGYKNGGHVSIGGGLYYPSYSLQMFDRKVKTLSTLYVGLVATKRELTPEIKKALLANSNLLSDSLDYKKLTAEGNADEDEAYGSFYTFKFVCFSDRAARQNGISVDADVRDEWQLAEPPGKKQKPVHYDDVSKGSTSFDPFEPVSLVDYRSMVGAWKIGRVMDTASRRRDTYSGGPIDTADQLKVNVNIEWCDWRTLRRCIDRQDIGGYVSGAAMWLRSVNYQSNSIVDQESNQTVYADQDDKRIFNWPSEYIPRGSASSISSSANDVKIKAAEATNIPVDVERSQFQPFDLKIAFNDQIENYKNKIKVMNKIVGDDSTPLGIQRRIVISRKLDTTTKLTKEDVDAIWDNLSENNTKSSFTLLDFSRYITALNLDNAEQFKIFQAFFGAHIFKTSEDWKNLTLKMWRNEVERTFIKMTFFTNGEKKSNLVNKKMLIRFLLFTDLGEAEGGGNNPLNNVAIGDNFDNSVNTIVDHEIHMMDTSSSGMTNREESTASSLPQLPAVAAKSTSGTAKSTKPKGKQNSKSAAPISASNPTLSTVTASTSAPTAAAASKPSGKPAAKSVAASSASVANTNVGATSDTSDLFSAIFGNTSVGNDDSDKSPSTGNPRSRARRGRDGR